jgi:hypothetical protein
MHPAPIGVAEQTRKYFYWRTVPGHHCLLAEGGHRCANILAHLSALHAHTTSVRKGYTSDFSISFTVSHRLLADRTFRCALPIFIPIAYLLCFTNRKRKYVEEKTTATLKSKQTSIATVRKHLRTVASLPTRLPFHYPLPLRNDLHIKTFLNKTIIWISLRWKHSLLLTSVLLNIRLTTPTSCAVVKWCHVKWVHWDHVYKEYKRIRIKPQEYFALYGEYAGRYKTEPISANFLSKPKKHQIRNQLPRHDRMAKEPSHATVLLNYIPPPPPPAGIARPRSWTTPAMPVHWGGTTYFLSHCKSHLPRATVFQLGRTGCRVGSTLSTALGLCGHDVLSCPIYTR